ncbi:DUF2147 domain-containing protein [Sneathia vaginalis]|uniref:DUF2147 domain-containing protein n=1 Tax=Sneathia vaginalis TaxID=187101 RepID=UPI00370D6444
MKKSILILSIIASSIFTFATKSDYFGTWQSQATKNGNVATIKIYEANNKLYGVITGMTHPKKDDNNPDKSKRNRNIVGITIISSFTYDKNNDSFENGAIYDPETGKTYYCFLKLENHNTLKVHGYVAGIKLLGRTVIWKRK